MTSHARSPESLLEYFSKPPMLIWHLYPKLHKGYQDTHLVFSLRYDNINFGLIVRVLGQPVVANHDGVHPGYNGEAQYHPEILPGVGK